jgi:hypothetical protein
MPMLYYLAVKPKVCRLLPVYGVYLPLQAIRAGHAASAQDFRHDDDK